MINLRLTRENPEIVRESQRARGEDSSIVESLLKYDLKFRLAISVANKLRSNQKIVGKLISTVNSEERPILLKQAKKLSRNLKKVELIQTETKSILTKTHIGISNIVSNGVINGNKNKFIILDIIGEPKSVNKHESHIKLGERLGLFDINRGSKVSGSGFYFLTDNGALMQLSLLQLAAQLAIANGFRLILPPVMVRPEIMLGTGFLNMHAEEIYHLRTDDLFLVGTSEVPIAGFHANEILNFSNGPIRYAGWSSCFRREAGSYGKDSHGLIRVHQFDKIEGFIYCKPDEAENEHKKLLSWQSQLLSAIEVPYRIIDIAAGDLGNSAARKYDCEAWLPIHKTYREMTSASNCTTFQSRRLSIRYSDNEVKPRLVSTLNGTLATTRWLVAILENHQQLDGSLYIPDALVPFMGTKMLEPSK